MGKGFLGLPKRNGKTDFWGWLTGRNRDWQADRDLHASMENQNVQAQSDLNNQYANVKNQTDAYNQSLFKTMTDNNRRALGEAQRSVLGSAGARGLAGGAGSSVRALGAYADQAQKDLNNQISNIQMDSNQRLANMLYGGQRDLSNRRMNNQDLLALERYKNKRSEASGADWLKNIGKAALRIGSAVATGGTSEVANGLTNVLKGGGK